MIVNMVHPGRGIFGSDFGTTTFVISKTYIKNYVGRYYRLFDSQGEVHGVEERRNAFLLQKRITYHSTRRFYEDSWNANSLLVTSPNI